MDRHDRPSPGRYDESSPLPESPSFATEYLSSEPRPSRVARSAAARSSGRRRTLVISAAAAVVAAAVTAGGVIALTGGPGTAAPASSTGKQVAGQDAEDAAPADAETDPDDATLGEAPAAADPAAGDAGAGAAGSGGSGGSGGGQDAQPDAPVRDGDSAKNKQGEDAQAPTGGGSGVGPDGNAGYVEPLPQQPNAFKGIGKVEIPGPAATPKPTAKPSATPTPKPKPKPRKKPTATPTKKPTPAPQGGGTLVTAENEVARLTNEARADQGCGPLRIDEKLRAAARGHSDDMAAKSYFDHTSADGRSPWDRIKAAGYKSSMFAENIARGQASPEAVVKAWLNSPGHRANIMNCKLKAIGVGVHFGSGGPWWTQDFGGD
ncbi:CAP domain-containing protein [Sphaerisporangium aureirubrum]|uniref:CAP domain-containing protein n=1 Tax=Sphaerisporangium aureirubrum TaxID=1544736 RepID=A0ABW1NN74_9ACTN